MKIGIKCPNEELTFEELPEDINTLKMLQEKVGGYIERVAEFDEIGIDIDIWINEEGKLMGLEPNFPIYDGYDFVVGNAVFAGSDREGNTIGLTEEQVEFLKEEFS